MYYIFIFFHAILSSVLLKMKKHQAVTRAKPQTQIHVTPFVFPTMLTDTVCPEHLISDGANGAKIATAVKWLIELLPGLNFSSWERDRETRLRSPFMRIL